MTLTGGTYVMDGKLLTEKIERTSIAGSFSLNSRKVSDTPKQILICGCCKMD